MSLPFSLKTCTICFLTLLALSAASCGVANRQILPSGPNIIPGGGSSGGGGGSGSGSGSYNPYTPAGTISPPTWSIPNTKPTDYFSLATEEINVPQTEDITFTAVSNTVNLFSVTLVDKSKDPIAGSGDWTVSTSTKSTGTSNCTDSTAPVSLVTYKTCVVTVTFKPKQLASYNNIFNTYLTYTYTDQKGVKQNPPNIQLLNSSFTTLLLPTPPKMVLDGTLLNNFISSLFVGTNFLGLTGSTSPYVNNIYAYDVSSTAAHLPINIASNVSSYGAVSTPTAANTLFYTQISTKTSSLISAKATSSAQATLIKNNVINVGTDNNKTTYGADSIGNVYTITSGGTTTLIATIPPQDGAVVGNDLITADLSNNSYIYGVFSDSTNTKHYLCSLFTNTKAVSCSQNSSLLAYANGNVMITENGNVFVFTLTPNFLTGQNLLNMAWNSNNNLLTIKALNTPIPADIFYQPIYDAINNTIDIVSSVHNSTYTLTEINVADPTNIVQVSHIFAASETISPPFLSTGTNNPHSKVFVVSTLGTTNKIVAFSNIVAKGATDLTPFIFNDGSGTNNYYLLPTTTTTSIYPKAAAIYNNNLFIPTSDSNTATQTNYLFPLNW